MRYTFTAQQRFFFSKRGYIEFEQLLTPPLLERALSLLSGQKSDWEPSRQSAELRTLLMKQLPHSAGCGLLGQPTLRLAFDQFYNQKSSSCGAAVLESIGSVRPIVGGLLIRLSGYSADDSQHPSQHPWLPTTPGHGTFLSPTLPIDQDRLHQEPDCAFWLIAYLGDKALYTLTPEDPHTHELKTFGYVFGDQVEERTHPLLARERL